MSPAGRPANTINPIKLDYKLAAYLAAYYMIIQLRKCLHVPGTFMTVQVFLFFLRLGKTSVNYSPPPRGSANDYYDIEVDLTL